MSEIPNASSLMKTGKMITVPHFLKQNTHTGALSNIYHHSEIKIILLLTNNLVI